MEPESSLPYSQVPATCHYPEPTPSSPQNPLPVPEDPPWYYPSIYVWVSPMVSFPQVSPPRSVFKIKKIGNTILEGGFAFWNVGFSFCI